MEKFHSLKIRDLIRIKRKRFKLKNNKKKKRVYISFKKYFRIINQSEKNQELHEVLCDMGILSFTREGNKPVSIEEGRNTYYVSKKCIPAYINAKEAKLNTEQYYK